ncbi:msx2-interacting protein isoform X2 [Chanos chanos]|uniref:Msx2-interacting protein n=1 Tax=Chanos chanos TaxID=29144 RepID=A0A6J2UVD7_CHACN|nr:msx2-interacting protein isoform X2 [Chanos chanos]
MVRETRHLWVGNLPENVREEKIIEHFKRYGRVESVKVLPKRGSEGGVAAFVDFVDIKSAQKAHNSINKMGDRDLRTDYNEPGTIPSAARGLDDSLSISTRGRDVSGFTRGAGGPAYGPSASLHSREGRYERRLDGTAESRERAYDHSAYGHHERGGSSSFDRQRHYDTDYYRDPRDRALSGGGGSSSSASGSSSGGSSAGVSGGVGGTGASSSGAGGSGSSAAGVGGGSAAVGVGYYGSRSRSPSRFEATETRYEPRAREPFTLASVVHRDLYREERGRRGDRTYHHSRSRSPHSSQSHNPSPQRLASQAARPPRSPSGSGSRSRSSSSDSVSSTSSSSSDSESSSSSSDASPARSVQSAAVPAPSAQPLPALEKDEPRKSFGIKVQNLPVRSTDTSLKDGLFHEFKKHGKVTSVQIHGASEERYGLVFFRQQEDQEKALSSSKGKLFFGMQIEVTAWNGPETESENEFRPLDERIDEFHPKATRTLFIGNLEKTTSYHDLLNIFQRFGEIVDIDIKKVNGAPQYAFLQYCDIASVCKAIKKMDGEYLGNNRLKLGFGKSMPTTCVWLDGLASNITEQYLTRHFCRYGHVVKVVFDRLKGMALILYNNIEYAQAAVKETKGWKIGGNKIKVDFANQESQMAFYRSMQASGQDIREFYEILSERRDERRPPYHEFSAERAYYENVRTPGSYTEDPRRKYSARGREFYTEWDPYQGDYYEPRYYDDPREYRDYRDPYEQDIRKYSYLQRERERERERDRFETDRERDHGRRTIEHSQSPTHPRRPASPAASPSLSERIPSDSEHHIYSRSSERSGSCSSLSPPRYEKPDKIRLDRYKNDKERPLFESERGNVTEKERRGVRKEKGDKERNEKHKLRKFKLASPSIPSSETDPEPDRDASPDAGQRGKGSKLLSKEKDTSEKGRLDLPPCVVQLTRVKEKEGKLTDHPLIEKPRLKVGSDGVRSPPPPPPPLTDQKILPVRNEFQKSEVLKHGKILKEKGLASQIEVVDKEGKVKGKKYLKPDPGFDSTNSPLDVDRLAARKRRFEEMAGKTERLKKVSLEEEDGRLGLKRIIDGTFLKDMEDDKRLLRKEIHKKEHRKAKQERLITVCSTRDGQDSEVVSMGMEIGLSVDLQSRLGEPTEEATDPLDNPDQMGVLGAKSLTQPSLTVSDDGSFDSELFREQEQQRHPKDSDGHSIMLDKDGSEKEEQQTVDIDHTQSCRKQMEQNRRRQQLQEYEKSDKPLSPPNTDADELEHRSLVHEVDKPPQDVTDDSPPSKRKKLDAFDIDFSSKRERNYRSSKQLNEDSDRPFTSLPVSQPLSSNEEEAVGDSPHLMTVKLPKESPKAEDKVSSHLDVFRYNLDNSGGRVLSPQTEVPKIKATSIVAEDELRWETRMRQDTLKMDMSFPSSIVKREGIRKRLVRELEPGEVQSDSDDDTENKHHSPKTNAPLSYFQREREERLLDLKLSGSLEKNKFYEFALDKTITPDTKALLERAKSLSSSREDNWSFLGHDSRFTSFRNSSDKEKVEPTPRPIPSWYMKKKKTRTDSEGKLDDKKEVPKPEEQERQELFASRFLHSSIFEQDSRRLRHLERKDFDLDVGLGKDAGRASTSEENAGAGSSDLSQEPIVLFHSRFLELQQQKDKDQRPRAPEKTSVAEWIEGEKIQVEEQRQSPKVLDHEIKPVSPVPAPSISPSHPLPKEEVSPQQEKPAALAVSTDVPVSPVKDEKMEITSLISPSPVGVLEETKPVPVNIKSPNPTVVESELHAELKQGSCEPKGIPVNAQIVEHDLDVKPPTPGASLSNFEPEPEPTEYPSTMSPQPKEIQNMAKVEGPPESSESQGSGSPNNISESTEVQLPLSEPEVEPTQPTRKQPKNKKTRTNISTSISNKPVSSPQPPQTALNEKPATRKSERIDKEKLKRASSPRGDASKVPLDSRSTAKSPVHAPETEQMLESSLLHGRTRRRNVRSVYATPPEGETPQQQGKEVAESPRSMRKRGADKDSTQDVVAAPTTARRGRPPKARKRGEDVSPSKGDLPKVSEGEDNDSKDSGSSGETNKAAEGWRSPRTQKIQSSPPGSGQSRRGGKTDKQSETSATVLQQKASVDVTVALEPQSKVKDESFEQVANLSEEDAKQPITSAKREKEKESVEHAEKKSSEEKTEDKSDADTIDKLLALEKSGKMKASRMTRNTKSMPEDKSVSLKNLVINLSVDAVKSVVHCGEEEQESFEGSMKKIKPAVSVKEELNSPGYLKEATELSPNEKEDASDPEPPADPAAALLARQIELERAVENISKLAVEQSLPPYKEPHADNPPTLLSPVVTEPEDETEEEKPANPASETELAAAIDSITAEDISADADGFTAPTTYTALPPTPEPLVVLPQASEAMEPETHLAIRNIMDSDSDISLMPDSKSSEPSSTDTAVVETSPPETAKKGGRVRPRTPKKYRSRKTSASRRGDIAEESVLETESSTVKLPESIPEDIESTNPKAATSSEAAAVVTVAAACKHDVASTVILDTPKEAEQPAVEQPEPQESASHSGPNSPPLPKPQQPSSEPVVSLLTPSATRLNAPHTRPGKIPVSPPDWRNRTEEAGVLSASQMPVAVSTPVVAGIGGPSGNPPMPPDTKASDIDPSSSTLRKILMEPKYVSASNSNSVPSMLLTTTLADPRMSENENSSEKMCGKPPLLEDKSSSITPLTSQPIPPQAPSSQSSEAQQIFVGNPVNSSNATSVISKIPIPFDLEETPRISLSSRSAGMPLPKQKYRPNMNENSRYHGLSMPDEGRPVLESTALYNTGSSPGLRVNTSEGVVVLSYSGQKTEGPQRISAKISQIPPASAVDIEFQQSVSKSQIKQEPLTPSQPSTPKGSQTPTGFGHAGVVLTAPPYNTQPVISTIKQESPGSDKCESSYLSGGPVKMFQQSISSPQVLKYNQAIIQQPLTKKTVGPESLPMKADAGKPPQASSMSPVLSPHHPSLTGNHISSPNTPNDRSIPHPKQEPHSPRPNHSTSPFSKVCPPSSSVVLGSSVPMSQYVSSVHHPEQSVIMTPHSVNTSVPMGHLSQGDVRMNTPPVNYGIRPEALASPRSGPQPRSTTPQPVAVRDLVLQSHPGASVAGSASGAGEDDVRHFHKGLRRPSAPQLQPDVMVIQSDFRGIGGLRLDQYSMAPRDVRILMHHQLGEHPGVVEARQARTPETSTAMSSTHISSASSKAPPVGKSVPQPVKDAPKLPSSPHTDSRIIGHPPVSVMVSPQGMQLMHPGSSGSIPEYYRDLRGFHPQFSGHPMMTSHGIANNPSQVPPDVDHGQRSKVGPLSSAGSVGGVEPKPEASHLRHPSSIDLSHMPRVQGESASPSYASSMTITHKSELVHSAHKGPQSLIASQVAPSSGSSQMRSDIKLEHTGHRSVDMMQLLTRYPIVWQGHLALKNDTAAVQLHFVSGNNVLAQRSLPPPDGGPLLRIAQRMRLEASQLEGVARRMTMESDYCLLLALPCGRDQEDVLNQTHALKSGFITYLQAKQAAGIINVPNPGSNQPAYVVQIFPPCEFSEGHLSHLAPDLLNSISSISPHLMIVIASV